MRDVLLSEILVVVPTRGGTSGLKRFIPFHHRSEEPACRSGKMKEKIEKITKTVEQELLFRYTIDRTDIHYPICPLEYGNSVFFGRAHESEKGKRVLPLISSEKTRSMKEVVDAEPVTDRENRSRNHIHDSGRSGGVMYEVNLLRYGWSAHSSSP